MNSICKMHGGGRRIHRGKPFGQRRDARCRRGRRAQKPIPTLHCEFKAMSACTPDGDCKEGTESPASRSR